MDLFRPKAKSKRTQDKRLRQYLAVNPLFKDGPITLSSAAPSSPFQSAYLPSANQSNEQFAELRFDDQNSFPAENEFDQMDWDDNGFSSNDQFDFEQFNGDQFDCDQFTDLPGPSPPEIPNDPGRQFDFSDFLFDFNDHQEEPDESERLGPQEKSRLDDFLTGLLELLVTENVKLSVFTKFLKLVKSTLNSDVPSCYQTLINRCLGKSTSWDYYIRCQECRTIFSFKREQAKNIQCSNPSCLRSIDFKQHIKTWPATCSFSMKDQLVNISEHYADLTGLPESPNSGEVFKLKTSFSFDGIPIFKSGSTKVELYPTNVFISNIENCNIKNSLVVHKSFTLIKSDQKIDYELAMTPFIEEANHLSQNLFRTNWSHSTKLKVECFQGDAPCRHALLGVQSHAGEYFCFNCPAKKGSKQSIPLKKSYDLSSLGRRSMQDMQDSLEILNQQRLGHLRSGRKESTAPTHFQGYKEVPILSKLWHFDCFSNTIVEPMHAFFLGECKKFLDHYWNKSKTPYYLAPNVNPNLNKKLNANNRLLSLKVPSSVPRQVRALDDCQRYCSTENRYFLFFYSFFTFNGVLPENHFSHFMLLASFTFKLVSRRCNELDVSDAVREIDKYLEGLEDERLKYNDAIRTYNSHICVHAPEDRIKFGPLANLSADGYESQLRLYKNDFNHSQNPRIETLCMKLFLKTKLNLIQISAAKAEKICSSDAIALDSIDAGYLEYVNRQLRLVSQSGIAYYKEAKNNGYRFRSAIHFQTQYNDSFIRMGEEFFVVLYLCKLDNKGYLLAKKVPIEGNAQCTFFDFAFQLKQIKQVSQRFSLADLKSPQSVDPNEHQLFELSSVRCHAMYVEQNERNSNLRDTMVLKKYLVDIEH